MPRGHQRRHSTRSQRSNTQQDERSPSTPSRPRGSARNIIQTRRSTRIEERTNQNPSNRPLSAGAMADVAHRAESNQRVAGPQRTRVRQSRRRQGTMSRRQQRSRQHQESQSRSTQPVQIQSNSQSNGYENIYPVSIISQLPSQVEAGAPSTIPLLLRLRTNRVTSSLVQQARLFGVVSLALIGPTEDAIPHEAGVLIGPHLVSTVSPDEDETSTLNEDGSEERNGWLTFPSLAIRDTGLYSLRVTLYQMEESGSGAHAVQMVQVGTITVV